MAKQTENYNLTMPEGEDYIDVAVLADNFQKIDTALAAGGSTPSADVAEIKEKVTDIAGKIGTTTDTGGTVLAGTVMAKLNFLRSYWSAARAATVDATRAVLGNTDDGETMETVMGRLKKNGQDAKADAEAVKGELAQVKTGVTEGKAVTETVKADVAEVKTNVAGVKTDVALTKADVAEVKKATGEVQTGVAGVQAGVADVSGKIGDVADAADGTVLGRIGKNGDTRATSLFGKLAEIITKLGTISTQVSNLGGKTSVVKSIQRGYCSVWNKETIALSSIDPSKSIVLVTDGCAGVYVDSLTSTSLRIETANAKTSSGKVSWQVIEFY